MLNWRDRATCAVTVLPSRARSAGAAAEAVDVHDHDRAGFEAEPAAGGEVGQGLVDGLAGGTDQLGELLLGEVVVDVDAVVGGAAEAVGQVEQRLRDPAGYVGEWALFRIGGEDWFPATDQFAPGGLLGLALDRATTVPMAMPAPASAPSRINSERERFCLAGAIAAPEGVEAAVPVDFWTSAAAAPLGCGGAGC